MLRRVLINPLTTLVLFTLLLLDARSLPRHNVLVGWSTIGSLLHGDLLGSSVQSGSAHYDALVAKTPSGIRLLRPNDDGWDEAITLLEDRRSETAILSYTTRTVRTGLWAITREHREFILEMTGGSSFTEADRLAARAALIRSAFTEKEASTPEVRRFATANVAADRILWRGYLHNALSLCCFCLLLNSLRWIPRTPAYFRARRAARDQCPHCGYSRAGLTTTTCPECGNELEPRA